MGDSMVERILVTGGAGFVGSNIAIRLKQSRTDIEVIALDNLSRDGAALCLSRLHDAGVGFVHGDVRVLDDIQSVGPVDWLIECSAEPSVHAGYGASPQYLIQTNLLGAINCLEHLRQSGGRMIFLSSSRIYPIAGLRGLPLSDTGSRLDIEDGATGEGWSANGISEAFPLDGVRSMYGATKLSAELLIQEYVGMYGLQVVINRCGVLAGPWQFGKVDQGFVALWVARHVFKGDLAYMGFGGAGRQVRDIMHVDDLFDLIEIQMARIDEVSGTVYNIGGGRDISVSLSELTDLCEEISGNSLSIAAHPETRDADIPYYVTDYSFAEQSLAWRPKRDVRTLVSDVHEWLVSEQDQLRKIFQ